MGIWPSCRQTYAMEFWIHQEIHPNNSFICCSNRMPRILTLRSLISGAFYAFYLAVATLAFTKPILLRGHACQWMSMILHFRDRLSEGRVFYIKESSKVTRLVYWVLFSFWRIAPNATIVIVFVDICRIAPDGSYLPIMHHDELSSTDRYLTVIMF